MGGGGAVIKNTKLRENGLVERASHTNHTEMKRHKHFVQKQCRSSSPTVGIIMFTEYQIEQKDEYCNQIDGKF